jgi:hypothetical protein
MSQHAARCHQAFTWSDPAPGATASVPEALRLTAGQGKNRRTAPRAKASAMTGQPGY